jgi:hypothetical protein
MTLRLHEKLRGDAKPVEAIIKTFEKIELKKKTDIDIHNLKKLRSAMNLVSGHLADTENAEDDVVAKAGYELVKNKINGLKDLDVKNTDVKRLQDNVNGFVNQCGFVFHPGVVSDKERAMRSKGMRSVQAMPCSGQSQNMMRQMKKPSAMRYNKTSEKTSERSELQSKVRQTDYSRYSDSDSE